jgi:hypothetical protein
MDPITSAALISGGLSAGSSIFGGMLGSSAQSSINAQQLAFAQENLSKQVEQADYNRQHQLYMSNTAMQRAKSDMVAAGFNPILALGQPASMGSGGGSVGVSTPNLGNPGSAMQAGITSAGDAIGKAAAVKVALQQSEKDSSQTDLNKATQTLTEKQGSRTEQETSTSKSAEDLNRAAEKRTNAETTNKVFEGALMRANANSADALARVNNRIAEDTEKYGDSQWSKAVGGVMRILNTYRANPPNSAVDASRSPAIPPLNPSTNFMRRRYGEPAP